MIRRVSAGASARTLGDERDEIAVLARIVEVAGSSLALEEILGEIARGAEELFGTEWNLVLLVEGERLVPRAWTGFESRELRGLSFPADTGLLGRVLSGGASVQLDPDALSEARALASVLAGVRSGLAAPLQARGRRVGALLAAAGTPRRFSQLDETLLRTLAGQAALAVERARLVEELLHADRLSTVGRMLAGVAHELNNPLAVVMGTLDLIRQEPIDSRVSERLARVSDQAQRAVKIVRTLLALARKRPTQRRPVDLTELLASTLELGAYDFKNAEVRVVRRFRESLPPILGDPDQLQQVFTNLVLNATQAMDETHGGGTLTVATDLDREGDRVVVTITDDGPGIRPEHLPRLFEPFFTTKGEGKGTGLGLAICRHIVESHDGRIRAASGPEMGAEFTVELPVCHQTPGHEAAARGDAEVAPIGGVRVLLVEDEPLVGDMLADVLALEGHQVDRATNGREALVRVGSRPYTLIVSDIRMPDLDGPAFYAELLGVSPALARRVVFVTGDVVSAETRRFLDETGLLYLEKPFAIAEFLSTVRRALTQG
ncbi:MAG TPA: ATP-binding protein [Methylomirabilota bacterium]|nr:ATP-binding protein [Methylomirabilota bacterium]